MRHVRILQLVLILGLALFLSSCGSRSILTQFEFGGADISGGVQEDGEVLMDVGANISAFGYDGRLVVSVDTVSGRVLFCFVWDPYVDPLPVCYPVEIEAWTRPEEGSGEPSASVGSVDLVQLLSSGDVRWDEPTHTFRVAFND